jgi:hypothetical protein
LGLGFFFFFLNQQVAEGVDINLLKTDHQQWDQDSTLGFDCVGLTMSHKLIVRSENHRVRL